MEIETEPLEVAADEQSREVASEAANRLFSAANETLTHAGDDLEYETFPVVQAARPPQWDDREGAFIIRWPHVAAPFFEHGTTKHEVEANEADVLAFDWPEMANEQFADTGKTFKEVFSETWPTVFFPSVQVDGIPRIGFVRSGIHGAARWLRQQGDN